MNWKIAALCLIPLSAVPATAAVINDYPTAARADYVFGCMASNGETLFLPSIFVQIAISALSEIHPRMHTVWTTALGAWRDAHVAKCVSREERTCTCVSDGVRCSRASGGVRCGSDGVRCSYLRFHQSTQSEGRRLRPTVRDAQLGRRPAPIINAREEK